MEKETTALFSRAGRAANRLSPLLWQGAAAVAGFALGRAALPGGTAPLGVGFVLGCPSGYLLSAAVGVIVGGLALPDVSTAVPLAGAVGAAASLRLAFKGKFCPGAVGGLGVLALIQLLLWREGAARWDELFGAMGTGIIALLAGWAIHQCPLSRQEGAHLWLLLAGAGLQGIAVGSFQPGFLALGAMLISAAWGGSPERTALCGGLMALGCAAVTPSLCFGVPGFLAGGFLAAALCRSDRVGAVLWFLGGSLPWVMLAGNGTDAGAFIASVLGSAVISLALPVKILECFPAGESLRRPVKLPGASRQLNLVADTLSEIAETVNEVWRRLPAKGQGFDWVVDYIAREQCAGCEEREGCWVERYSQTMDGFNHLRPVLEEKGRIEPENMPRQLSCCVHPTGLCAALTRGYALLLTRRAERARCRLLRAALTEQYSAIAQALAAMAEQLSRVRMEDTAGAQRLARLFSGLGLEPLETSVTQDGDGRTRARVSVARIAFSPQELAALGEEVGHLCRRTMGLPQVQTTGAATTLVFSEKAVFCPAFGLASRAAKEVCGDSAEQFCDVSDRAWMILCDGMGQGRPAAVDGALASRLTGQLLRAGFAVPAAARLVNVALSLKGEEDAGATLDLFSVDLFTGRGELFKAGAAPSFLVRGGVPRLLEGSSLPVGILETVTGRTTSFQMGEGDWLILLSDGALVDGSEWVLQQLELCTKVGNTPQETADILADSAQRRTKNHPDDITAAVLRLDRVM